MSKGTDTIYNMITEKIISLLDKGVTPWRQGWENGSSKLPANGKTGKSYRGVNVIILLNEQLEHGYKSNLWLSFKQASDLKGKVKQGEKGTQVIYWQIVKGQSKAEDGSKSSYTFPMLKYYTVFNSEQIEGLKQEKFNFSTSSKKDGFNAITEAEKVVTEFKTCPRIESKQNRAYYSPSADYINMPAKESINSVEGYYSVLFHELTHSTGHKDRLAREGITNYQGFGTDCYSKEELVAELGASFLCAIAEIGNNQELENQAAYLASWKSKLKKDNKLIVQAASAAQKAVDYILGISFTDKKEEG
jgi:antirestriction protein ArdC